MRKSATIFAATAAMLWMAGCADKDPVSSQDEGTDSPSAKLVISSTKAGRGLGAGGPVGVRRKITVDLPGGAKMKFVLIDPGTFTMGSNATSEHTEDELQGPAHQVMLTKGFYLGQYEITQGQWEAIMGTRPWVGKDDAQSARDNPASYISWYETQEFIHKLNQAAGDSLYRLPTEAEWEYACRAGTTTRWSFGDDESQLKDYAWYADNTWIVGDAYPHRVGTKLPNPWGLYDMHGNVYEWGQEFYYAYSAESQIDPRGNSPHGIEEGGIIRRSGGWADEGWATHSAFRLNFNAGDRYNDLGARLVRIKK